MTSWTEILKANKGLHARDSFSELWGLKLKAARAEFPDYTITGTLPLTFNSRAAVALKNYRIHGTSAGAGVETENLVEGIIEETNLDDRGIIISNTLFNMYVAKIVEGQEYTITTSSSSGFVYGLFRTFPAINSQSYDNSRVIGQSTFTAPIDGYIAFRAVLSDTLVMLTEGSTAPTSYIPYGYKIPILNTSGVTENICPAITEENGWRPGYRNANTGTYNSYNRIYGEFLSPKILIDISQKIVISAKAYESASMSLYFWNGDSYLGSVNSTNYQGFTYDPGVTYPNATDFDFAIRTGSTNIADVESSGFWVMINYGNSALPYVPHRYESNYDLLIGDSKLYEDEYLDFVEQKIYKISADLWDVNGMTTNQSGTPRPGNEFETLGTYVIENNSPSVFIYYREGVSTITGDQGSISAGNKLTIQTTDTLVIWLTDQTMMPYVSVYRKGIPTDPPAPFPAILTYQGENTLSSTETLGEVSITGKITEMA